MAKANRDVRTVWKHKKIGPDGQAVSFETGRLVRSLGRPVEAWDFGTRQDINVSAKDRLNARYFYRDRFGEKDIANLGGYSSDFYTEYHNAGASWIRSITPAVVNELRFGLGRENVMWSGADGSPFSEIGRNIALFIMPTGYLGFGTAANFPQIASSRSLEFQDNLSRQTGRHGLKVGGHYGRVNAHVATRRLYNGQFQFNTFHDFVDNRPATFTGAAGNLVTDLSGRSASVYFQDDFRLKPNLTFNLGIRYESAKQPAASLHDFTVRRESNPATALWDTGDTTRAFSANPHAPRASTALVQPGGTLVDFHDNAKLVNAWDVRWIYNDLAAARMFGTPFGSGRNVMRGPSFNQADLALYKNFKRGERFRIQLRFESTNSFNHPNLGPGEVFIDQRGFLNPSETEAEPRRIAVGLRISF